MRKTTKIYKDIPADYPLCLHNVYPMDDSYLRRFVDQAFDIDNMVVNYAKFCDVVLKIK